jgi:predicted GNAT family acetyltransferase
VEVELLRDAEEFAARAEGFVVGRLERNVLATVLDRVRAGGGYGATPPLFAVAGSGGGGVAAAAIRTPPWRMLADGFTEPDLARALVDAWLGADPGLPGVFAQGDCAQAIAAAFTEATGGGHELLMAELMHELSEVADPPRPAAGSMRQATLADRELLLAWELAFIAEAGVGIGEAVAERVERRIAAGLQYMWLDSEGQPVCTVAHNPIIAGVGRIGPVYTPPEHRGHGYASSAVAAVSRRLLAEGEGAGASRAGLGAPRCVLFTDAANPTSNRIYASVGFTPLASFEELRFTAPRAKLAH